MREPFDYHKTTICHWVFIAFCLGAGISVILLAFAG
tara:strand:+ start:314 stop:421 length:108 start_codon:yes stop_codon:yes gene_type:complete